MLKGILSQENIHFQDGSFFNGLVKHVTKIREMYLNNIHVKDISESSEAEEMLKYILNKTGINIEYFFLFDCFSITVPRVKNGHIFYPEEHRKKLAELAELYEDTYKEGWFEENRAIKDYAKLVKETRLTGSIDYKKAKVSGVFSKIPCELFMDTRAFVSSVTLTDYEVAAILCHELGHIFNQYMLIDRVSTTNQALAMFTRCLENKLPQDKKEFIFVTISDNSGINKDTTKSLLEAKSVEELCIIMAQDQVETAKSELGHSLYDYTSCEYLADNFAVRLGAGKYLASGLIKNGPITNFQRLSMIISAVSLTVVTFGLFYIYVVFSLDNKSWYDADKPRLLRIKYQLIGRLKNNELPDSIKIQYLEDIKDIDLFTTKIESYNNIAETIAYYIRPRYRKEKDFETLQRQLEALNNNSLFARAVEIGIATKKELK